MNKTQFEFYRLLLSGAIKTEENPSKSNDQYINKENLFRKLVLKRAKEENENENQ